MNMRQTLLAAALFGCASQAPPEPAPGPAAEETSAWSSAVETEAASLRAAFPQATVRIAVVDVASGDLLASHGPIDTEHFVGSTVKAFTVAAALEAGVPPATELDTGDGTATLGDATVRDHAAHGTITVTQALARSSNVAIVRLVEQVGLDELYRRVAGLVPLPDRARLDDVSAAEILYGGHLTLTTEQLVHGYAVLAAGGTDPGTGDRLVEESSAAAVLEMLTHAVNADEGTGRRAAVDGRPVAGKTGTAPRGDAHTALFVGVTEAEGRPVVVGVVVDGVPTTEFGGTVAAPAFARLVQRAAP